MKAARILLTTLLAFVLVACWSSHGQTTSNPSLLRVALLPDENATTVIQNNQPLKNYLQSKLGKQIELVVTTDYSSMIEAMRRGRLELAYFGPLSYVLARSKDPDVEPFAALVEQAGGPPVYQALVIGNVGQNINAIADLNGKTVAYGDPASTSSHLIPKSMLADQGLRAGQNYQEQFVGAHDAVAFAVQNGNAAGGGISKPIFERLVQDGKIDSAKVHSVAESKPYPNYPWTMRSDLDAGLKAAIVNAFLTLTDPAVLKPFKAAGFARVSDADYDAVRALSSQLGLDLSKLSK
ncbi:phosphate/phosphite/phosphonate ABC transporter substrate-binding protein [Mycobacterium sp. 852002-51057_SCH5723018]|uniref:phosphate/phosphite/phosphonate ABC transporter substrate-binding protein n=1 Tax=Mycobacterium sp. 852002-51057_SCH5723018 TaxID=1834094 RepID=UPI00080248A8|nr:phosphate/phosphite/phosphonate ABC transporter substrate-binding protein [Mycobacterium sp. 852002-51057_SCH5723018]OBG19287.1 phosphate ABC transporter substrate-binding protein [Mycobacterium sp. 852002-51057_SCH5723018]